MRLFTHLYQLKLIPPTGKNVYHVKSAIKLGHYNVGREGELLTLPLYMGFLLEDRIEDCIIPDIDLSSLTVI